MNWRSRAPNKGARLNSKCMTRAITIQGFRVSVITESDTGSELIFHWYMNFRKMHFNSRHFLNCWQTDRQTDRQTNRWKNEHQTISRCDKQSTTGFGCLNICCSPPSMLSLSTLFCLFVWGFTSRSPIFQSFWDGFLGSTSTKQWGWSV